VTAEATRWSPVGLLRRCRTDRTIRREVDVMGLTACIALLVALSVGDDHVPHTRWDVLAIVWATTVGLALTHWFALSLSIRLVGDRDLEASSFELLLASVAVAVLVAIAATVVVLSLSADYDRLGARVTAAVCIGALVGIECRAGGYSAARSTAFIAGATIVATGVATAKWYIGR
jgi:hypothetical protein